MSLGICEPSPAVRQEHDPIRRIERIRETSTTTHAELPEGAPGSLADFCSRMPDAKGSSERAGSSNGDIAEAMEDGVVDF